MAPPLGDASIACRAVDGIGERFQQGCGLANPIGQGRAIQIEPFAVDGLALAVKGQVVGILADRHTGQQTWPGTTTLDGAGRQRGLDKPLAAGAGQTRANDAVHDVEPWSAFGSRTMARAREHIPVPRSHLRRSGAGARRNRHRHRRRASAPPPSGGCDPGSDGAWVCSSPRCPAVSAARSSRRRRSRWSQAPVAAALPSRTRP